VNNFSSRTLAAVLLLLVLACAGCVGAEEPSGQSTEKKARATGTPVVLDFGKGQCNQCIQQTAAIDEVGPQCDGKVDFKFVHVIEEVALAGSYQIFMIPTLVFLDAGGEEVFRNVGMLNADALRNKLEELGWAEF
jgi:thioredoxin-like negative regulator of GroEL